MNVWYLSGALFGVGIMAWVAGSDLAIKSLAFAMPLGWLLDRAR